MSQVIQQIGPSLYRVHWTEKPEDILTLNFNVFREGFKLTGSYTLVHWQAKPKGLRRFGIYDSSTDTYNGCDHDCLSMRRLPKAIQVDESVITTLPTAVLFFPDTKLRIEKSNPKTYFVLDKV